MYITVLDFTEGRVHQYNVTVYDVANMKEDHPSAEQIEDFLIGEGHRLTDCEWMSHSDGEIITDNAEI
tara:strand:+ start:390 stop:593 length:204 start_codon:yes stop_codon:yes gene_type:complete